MCQLVKLSASRGVFSCEWGSRDVAYGMNRKRTGDGNGNQSTIY